MGYKGDSRVYRVEFIVLKCCRILVHALQRSTFLYMKQSQNKMFSKFVDSVKYKSIIIQIFSTLFDKERYGKTK
jgi:hypothetical protein